MGLAFGLQGYMGSASKGMAYKNIPKAKKRKLRYILFFSSSLTFESPLFPTDNSTHIYVPKYYSSSNLKHDSFYGLLPYP